MPARAAGVPTRVRGAQLARLGFLESEGQGADAVRLAPAPETSSARLAAFQREVEAARREAAAATTGTSTGDAAASAGTEDA